MACGWVGSPPTMLHTTAATLSLRERWAGPCKQAGAFGDGELGSRSVGAGALPQPRGRSLARQTGRERVATTRSLKCSYVHVLGMPSHLLVMAEHWAGEASRPPRGDMSSPTMGVRVTKIQGSGPAAAARQTATHPGHYCFAPPARPPQAKPPRGGTTQGTTREGTQIFPLACTSQVDGCRERQYVVWIALGLVVPVNQQHNLSETQGGALSGERRQHPQPSGKGMPMRTQPCHQPFICLGPGIPYGPTLVVGPGPHLVTRAGPPQ